MLELFLLPKADAPPLRVDIEAAHQFSCDSPPQGRFRLIRGLQHPARTRAMTLSKSCAVDVTTRANRAVLLKRKAPPGAQEHGVRGGRAV
jgi:hypothetical protein